MRPKGYTVPMEICNVSDLDIYVYGVTYGTPSDGKAGFTYAAPPALPFKVDAGTCKTIMCNAASTNSSDRVFTMAATFTWGHNPTSPDPKNHPAVTTTISVTGTPPDCICPPASPTNGIMQSQEVAVDTTTEATSTTTTTKNEKKTTTTTTTQDVTTPTTTAAAVVESTDASAVPVEGA